MKEIILEVPEINYVLVHWPDNTYTPWVAAWAYRPDRNSWGQGHYFTTKSDAIEYLAEVYEERCPAYVEHGELKRRIREILAA